MTFGASAAITGLAGAAINAGSNFGASVFNNEEAYWREQEARKENYEYSERAAWNADTRTRRLYNDLYSPQAQMEQIKAAGLSPSLFYGDAGGVSGQAGAQGTGAAELIKCVWCKPNRHCTNSRT